MKEPKENQEFDQLFLKRFENFTVPPKPEDHQKIFNALEIKKDKKNFYVRYGIAASLLLAIGTFLFIWFSKSESINRKSTVTQSKSFDEQRKDNQLSKDEKLPSQKVIPERSKNQHNVSINKTDNNVAKNTAAAKNKEASRIILAGVNEKEVIMPDSSIITLHPNSYLVYQSNYKLDRKVVLTGDALFKIRKNNGKNFRVVSGTSVVEVLGTTFFVHAAKTTINKVSVIEGKVSFYLEKDENNKVELTAGESAFLNDQNHPQKVMIQPISKGSTKHEFVFKNTDLLKIISDLKGVFPEQIEVTNKSILVCTFSGTFTNPQNIEEVLDVITSALALKYIRQNGKIEISGNGCK